MTVEIGDRFLLEDLTGSREEQGMNDRNTDQLGEPIGANPLETISERDSIRRAGIREVIGLAARFRLRHG
jgi:hypothetical protein